MTCRFRCPPSARGSRERRAIAAEIDGEHPAVRRRRAAPSSGQSSPRPNPDRRRSSRDRDRVAEESHPAAATSIPFTFDDAQRHRACASPAQRHKTSPPTQDHRQRTAATCFVRTYRQQFEARTCLTNVPPPTRCWRGSKTKIGRACASMSAPRPESARRTRCSGGACPARPRARRRRGHRRNLRPSRHRAQLKDLEVIPRRKVEYRGVTMEEMDVDAIIASQARSLRRR